MRFLRWVIIGMTITAWVGTFMDIAFGGNIGRIFYGIAVGSLGLFIACLWVPGTKGDTPTTIDQDTTDETP